MTNRRLLLRGPTLKSGFIQFDPLSPFDNLASILGALLGAGCARFGPMAGVEVSGFSVASGWGSAGSTVGSSGGPSGAGSCGCCC